MIYIIVLGAALIGFIIGCAFMSILHHFRQTKEEEIENKIWKEMSMDDRQLSKKIQRIKETVKERLKL